LSSAPSSLIITADDFGFDATVNAAVARGLAQRLVSYASLIVNLDGFDDACRLIRSNQLRERVGLHVNLTEGAPLTEGIRRTLFCLDGRFAAPTLLSYYRLVNDATRRAVADEVEAQIAKARDAGIALTHLDSHNDMHTAPSIARVVADVAGAHGIGRIRPARNCGPRQGMVRWLHHRRYNALLARRGLTRIDYVGTIDDLLWLRDRDQRARPFVAEAMTHPKLNGDGIHVVDAPSLKPLAERVKELESRGFHIVQP
jgi:predicted glycoside hydrolase/deacetylase ChbG (UPF0249 family)